MGIWTRNLVWKQRIPSGGRIFSEKWSGREWLIWHASPLEDEGGEEINCVGDTRIREGSLMEEVVTDNRHGGITQLPAPFSGHAALS